MSQETPLASPVYPYNRVLRVKYVVAHASFGKHHERPTIGKAKKSAPNYMTSMLSILMSSSGFSLWVRAFSILWITSRPWTARPKMVCLLSSHGYTECQLTHRAAPSRPGQRTVFSVVIKN